MINIANTSSLLDEIIDADLIGPLFVVEIVVETMPSSAHRIARALSPCRLCSQPVPLLHFSSSTLASLTASFQNTIADSKSIQLQPEPINK